MSNSDKRIQKLSASGFEIADGEPDIRGWKVIDGQGKTIGEVDELLFDQQSLKVRYLIVELDEAYSESAEKDVLIPIGLAELHSKEDEVLLSNVSSEQISSLPEYDEDSFTADTESSIRNVFAGVGGATLAAGMMSGQEDFYAHDHFDDNRLYNNRKPEGSQTTLPLIEETLELGKRRVETGGLRIKSTIVEKPVQETVNLKQENVTIERTTVNRLAADNAFTSFKEGVIELKETTEVPVISKDARVVEEIIVGRDVEYREETIKETLRSTEVEVEQLSADRTGKSNSTE